MSKIIAYYRVSTAKQGASGLGLDAQRKAVQDHAQRIGATIAAEYTEVESGKLADRPELAKAIAHARRIKATLAIAKLDRLARNVAFVSALMESGCDFVACDNPHANKLTIHILAAVAEDEARRISERTKAALQAAKRRGQLLGSARPGHWRGRENARLAGARKGNEVSAAMRRRQAIKAVADLLPEMQQQRESGKSLASIAETLNQAGHRTTRGNVWTAMGVKLVLDRAATEKNSGTRTDLRAKLPTGSPTVSK
jgi:DNA invertase Pin-like site-specific DNA recombinase